MPFNLADYEPVEDRIQAFWSEHPGGRIETDLIHLADGNYIVKALVFKVHYLPSEGQANTHPDATGYAQETEGSTVVNKTSALENCETSAIGRALANLGYAAKGKRPSREEMFKAGDGYGVSTEQISKTSPAPGPAGTAGAGTTEASPSLPPQAGATSPSDDGEALGGSAPGEGSGHPASPSPGVTITSDQKDHPGPPWYVLHPSACDHRRTTGSHTLLSPRKSPRGPVCPRCGLSYITVKESTQADLGSA